MEITLNPSLIVQSTLTFVAAIVWSDAIKEVASAMKRDTAFGNAMVKILMAIIVLIVVVLAIWLFPSKHKQSLFNEYNASTRRSDI